MSAESELLARAVATELTAAGLDLAFEYNENPDIELKELQRGTKCTVRDLTVESRAVSRSTLQHEYGIEICIRRKVPSDVSPYVAELKEKGEAIANYYIFRSAVATRTERYLRTDNRQIRWDEKLKDQLVMKASLVLIFRGWTEV
jgi:hypothetical protein